MEIQAPNKLVKTVFLAGSIEMGKAENWQQRMVRELEEDNYIFYNPRRDDWDSTWEQKIENDQFREQVEWELKGQERADLIVMYFDPDTQSPISLLELGLFAQTKKMLVCCPTGYWKKGNVDIVCRRYGIEQAESLEQLIHQLKNHPVFKN